MLAAGVGVSGAGSQAVRGWCVVPCLALVVSGEVQTVLTHIGVDMIVDTGIDGWS